MLVCTCLETYWKRPTQRVVVISGWRHCDNYFICYTCLRYTLCLFLLFCSPLPCERSPPTLRPCSDPLWEEQVTPPTDFRSPYPLTSDPTINLLSQWDVGWSDMYDVRGKLWKPCVAPRVVFCAMRTTYPSGTGPPGCVGEWRHMSNASINARKE